MNEPQKLTGLARAIAAHESAPAAAVTARPAVTTFSAFANRRAVLFGLHGLERAIAACQLDADEQRPGGITTLAADAPNERTPFDELVANPKAREILGLDPRVPIGRVRSAAWDYLVERGDPLCCGQDLALAERSLAKLEEKPLTPEEKHAKKLDEARARVAELRGFMESAGTTPEPGAVKTFGLAAPLVVTFSATGSVHVAK